jgi:hypothetical protein
MEKLRFSLLWLGLFVICGLALSCGTAAMNAGNGQLQSIALSPATADAQSYPDGKVPFVASGTYVNPARTVTPQPAIWGACQKNLPTSDITVSSTGVATCVGGAAGAYEVFAYQTTRCDLISSCGGGCTIEGTAQLSCP